MSLFKTCSGVCLLWTAVSLASCSDDDGAGVVPKDPTANAGAGGSGMSGASGASGAGGSSGAAGRGGTSGSGGMPEGGSGGSAGCTVTEPPDAGDAGLTDAGPGDAGDPDGGDAAVSSGPVSFAADIHPIFAQRCGPCHVANGSGGHNVGSPDLDEAYSDAVKEGQTLVIMINGGGMPPSYAAPPNDCNGLPGSPGCVTVAELTLIQTWLAQCTPR